MKQVTYGEYLRLDKILDAQEIKSSPEQHDELLFIVIHQVYELWFKQILHEFDYIQKSLREKKDGKASKSIVRVLKIMKILVAQMDVIETMTPLEFMSFRNYLSSSSGFQSLQFRLFESKCGIHHYQYFEKDFGYDKTELERLNSYMESETLWESFVNYLIASGYKLTSPKRYKRNGIIFDPDEDIQNTILKVCRREKLIPTLCELMLDVDEGLQEWRYRHVKMVERTIGDKTGTGGSSGTSYLKSTLHQRIFPDLWEIRNRF